MKSILPLSCLEASIVVNGVNGAGEALGTAAPPATSGPSDGSATDNGPADSASSDGEPRNPAPRRRHRCRVSRSEPAQQAGSHDDKTAGLKKPRAKSQPPFSTKESRRASSRLDWTERMTEVRKTKALCCLTVFRTSLRHILVGSELKSLLVVFLRSHAESYSYRAGKVIV